uniref:BEN domain-containing protein n=1 Tax=Ixodes ricinus TaxID=34613 RepID=A0A147BR05_IXORI
MFALVRYKIDDTTAVVSTRYIKDMCPLHRDDFNPDFLYEVFWSGDASTKGGYYSAQIIHMAETEEEIQLIAGRTRKRPIPSTVAAKCPQAHKQKKKDAQQDSKRRRDMELLEKIQCDSAGSVSQKQYAEVVRKLRKKTEALEQCQLLNVKLQKALCENIEKAGCHRCQKDATGDTSPVYYLEYEEGAEVGEAELDPAWSTLTSLVADPSVPARPPAMSATSMPGAAQTSATTTIRMSAVTPPKRVMASQGDASGGPAVVIPPAASKEQAEPDAVMDEVSQAGGTPPATPPPVVPRAQAAPDPVMIDIGQNILLTKKKWEDLNGQMVDSLFTKEAATSIWGTDVLKGKSPTGKISNKAKSQGQTEAFPCLTPEKVNVLRDFFIGRLVKHQIPMDQAVQRAKAIRKYLSEKCTDSRR